MKYLLKRHDGEVDDLMKQILNSYYDSYDLLKDIYSDICCSDADYDDRHYYEIIEVND